MSHVEEVSFLVCHYKSKRLEDRRWFVPSLICHYMSNLLEDRRWFASPVEGVEGLWDLQNLPKRPGGV